MSNPFSRLKYLPWRSLLQVAGLTTLIVAALELFLAWAMTQSDSLLRAFRLMYSPPLGILILFGFALAMGVLAVYICERWNRIILNASTLWALAFCLLLGLFLKSLLPIPALLVELSQISFIAIVVGVFWKGRPYWR